MENSKNYAVYAAGLLYTLITGLSFLVSKIGLSVSGPFDLLAYRFSAAFLGLLILVLLGRVRLGMDLKALKRIMPLAVLYPLLFFSFQTFGLRYASSSEAGILSATIPIITLVLAAYFLRERTTGLQKLAVIVSVAGVIYITLMKGSAVAFTDLRGVILLLLSALSFAGYSVMARRLSRDFTSAELSNVMIIICFIAFNVLSMGNHLAKGTLNNFFSPLKDPGFILAALYLGVLSSLGTSLATNYMLSKMEASKMSVFSNLSTVISIIAGVVFLKEELLYYHLVGSILIIGGVIGTNFLDEKHLKGKRQA